MRTIIQSTLELGRRASHRWHPFCSEFECCVKDWPRSSTWERNCHPRPCSHIPRMDRYYQSTPWSSSRKINWIITNFFLKFFLQDSLLVRQISYFSRHVNWFDGHRVRIEVHHATKQETVLRVGHPFLTIVHHSWFRYSIVFLFFSPLLKFVAKLFYWLTDFVVLLAAVVSESIKAYKSSCARRYVIINNYTFAFFRTKVDDRISDDFIEKSLENRTISENCILFF